MVNVQDQEIYNYWAMKYDRLQGSMTHVEILYLITTRLRYNDDCLAFLNFILSQMKTTSGLDLIHRTIFNIYYTAAKCGNLGNPDIFDKFEKELSKYAHEHNQGRYWDKMRQITFLDISIAFEELFLLPEYENLNPALAESYKPRDPKIVLKDELDDQGNVIYY
jgi:hypothetical protein